MRLLLDTHTFVWFIEGNSSLSPRARLLIENKSNQLFLSVASLWEMAIKFSLGKLYLGQPFDTLVPQQLHANTIDLLGIEWDHIIKVAALPFHHRDPFDRMLIAQALTERLPIISIDATLDAYGIIRLW